MGSKNIDLKVDWYNPVHGECDNLTKAELESKLDEIKEDWFSEDMAELRCVVVGKYINGDSLFDQVTVTRTDDGGSFSNHGVVVPDNGKGFDEVSQHFSLYANMFGEYDEPGTELVVDICNNEGTGITVGYNLGGSTETKAEENHYGEETKKA